MKNGSAGIGTYAWCEATDGIMGIGEKVAVTGMLVRAQLREALDAVRGRSPAFSRRLARVALGRVPLPDTRAAREAEERAAAECSADLLLHCHRTYWWGALLAQADGLPFDAELLYVSSLLHDLGIAEPGLPHAKARCFAAHGAREAQAFALRQGWSPERATRAYEAVSLHLNPVVHRGHGAEARLLAAGATMDVIGAHRRRVPASVARAVHARFPRGSFREEILSTIHAAHAPGSRADFLRRLGFGRLAARNPMDGPEYRPRERPAGAPQPQRA